VGCPECWGTDGCLDTEDAVWGVCDRHRVKWRLKKDLPSSLPEKDNAERWQRNAERLSGFSEVQPVILFSHKEDLQDPVIPDGWGPSY
jgi:hypothetical protein